MQQNGVYASSATWYNNSPHQYCEVWIDFNNDGTFATSEEVSPVSGWSSTGSTPNPTTFNITIPPTANPGVHLMRMRGIWEMNSTDLGYAPAHVDPCLYNYGGSNPNYWSGDVADYYVNIVSLPPCTGTPTAGTASATVTSGCSAYSSMLSVAGTSTGSGLTYQWQSSADSTTWWL